MKIGLLVLALQSVGSLAQETQIQVIHLSDYHSHAVPFFSEGQADQGGLARTVGYIKGQLKRDPDTLVFNGGDTINFASPAWSDKYQCEDWKYFDGITQAMALGNHEFDYGQKSFLDCQRKVKFSILSANYIDSARQKPYFLYNGKPYLVLKRKGIRIGVIALAGMDFVRLVKKEKMPGDGIFVDPLPIAKKMIQDLKEKEKVNAIVLIGHRSYEEDVELAKSVPGIDVIFGSHSHRKEPLKLIEGTQTYYISPFQYLTYLSHLELDFESGLLKKVSGKLVKMDKSIQEDELTKQSLEKKQAELIKDKTYAERFQVVGETAHALECNDVSHSETELGNYVLDLVRAKAKAHLALATASSFRAAIPIGKFYLEDFLTAIPYRNKVLFFEMSGAQLKELIDIVALKFGTDGFSQFSGIRFVLKNQKVSDLKVISKPEVRELTHFESVEDMKKYKIAVADFQAKVAGGYREFFTRFEELKNEENFVLNDLVLESFKSTVGKAGAAALGRKDGRLIVR